MATGVLLLCLGPATRLLEYVVAEQKQYRATIRFGLTTDTLDAEGQITAVNDASQLDEAHLQALLLSFLGDIQQIPPLYSAIKLEGRPLYQRARAGETVEIAPRQVTIHDLTWVAWQPPDLTLNIICSAGTYIRSLARDLGEAAGPGAHLVELARTASGSWSLAEAVPLAQLEQEVKQDASAWPRYLHPADHAIAHLPQVTLTEAEVQRVQQGQQIQIEDVSHLAEAGPIRAHTQGGEFLAILTSVEPNAKLWQPKKVFEIK
jgi:tRNA pseudouridine55 synthase